MKWLKLALSLFKLISHVKNQHQLPVQHGRRESRVWRRQTPNDDETAHLLLLHPVSRVQVVGMREQGSIHPKVWPDETRCDQIVPGVTSWDQMVQGSARQGSRTRLKVGNGRVWLRHDSSHLRLADRHPFFSLLSHDLSHLANEASEIVVQTNHGQYYLSTLRRLRAPKNYDSPIPYLKVKWYHPDPSRLNHRLSLLLCECPHGEKQNGHA